MYPIEYFMPHDFSAVDKCDIFRNTIIKYGTMCYSIEKQFSELLLFVNLFLATSHT